MRIGNDLIQIIKNSFIKAYGETVCEFEKKKCGVKTSHFVSAIGWTIYEQYFNHEAGYKFNPLRFNEDGKGHRKEFLVDCSITKTIATFSKTKQPQTPIHAKMCLAIEGVTDPTLLSFGKHFSKLLCINSDHHLFLNAVTQRTKTRRAHYMNQRLNHIIDLLNSQPFEKKSFYIIFWPSPHDHLWDNFSKELLLNWIEVYEVTQDKKTKQYTYLKMLETETEIEIE